MTATTASLPVDLAEYGHLRRVPVHFVVWRELVMPSQRARIRVERDERIAVKVVSQTAAAVVGGHGIADTPEGQVALGVVASDLPDARTSGLPGIARPRFVTRHVRTRDGVETPGLTASGGVVCGDQAADAVAGGRTVAAAGAHEDFVLDDQRRVGDDITRRLFHIRWPARRIGGIGYGRIPDELACSRVDGQQVRIERAEEQPIAAPSRDLD